MELQNIQECITMNRIKLKIDIGSKHATSKLTPATHQYVQSIDTVNY